MGRVRTCYDNAGAESFFATLKKDLINRYRWPTRPDAQHAIFDFIERWYNKLCRGRHRTRSACTRPSAIGHRPSTSSSC